MKLRRDDVLRVTGLRDSELSELLTARLFPMPVSESGRMLWHPEEVSEWIARDRRTPALRRGYFTHGRHT